MKTDRKERTPPDPAPAAKADGSAAAGPAGDRVETAASMEAPAPTAEEMKELIAQAAKAKEHWEQLLRTAAEFENFKKRVARERQEAGKHAHESLLHKLIPVLDNLDMALAAANQAHDGSLESLRTGIGLIHQQLGKVLSEAGLEEINAAGKMFDPNWHEAVSQQEASGTPEGQVVQQLRKGYKLRDRLLRPAGVVVAKKPAVKPEE
jgi:molecular chaperone GrpE